jgi:hypothetical protein
VTYLGPDLVPDDEGPPIGIISRDLIPDAMAATTGCFTATTNANGGAEKNTFHSRMNFVTQYNDRPTDTLRYGTYNPANAEGVGTCGDGLDNDNDSGNLAYANLAPPPEPVIRHRSFAAQGIEGEPLLLVVYLQPMQQIGFL